MIRAASLSWPDPRLGYVLTTIPPTGPLHRSCEVASLESLVKADQRIVKKLAPTTDEPSRISPLVARAADKSRKVD